MPDNQYYVRIKEGAEPSLFKIPGVRGVGLGPKFVAGRAIGKLAIQVFVECKRPPSSLEPEEIIPQFIEDVPTDVLEWEAAANTNGEITVDDCPTGNIQDIKKILTGTTFTDLEIISPSHGLFDNARVRITGSDNVLHTKLAYAVTVKDDDSFIIKVRENDIEISPLDLPYVANSASWINVSTFDTLCCCPGGPIEFVGVTDKVTIGSPSHGLLNGDRIKVRKSGPKLEDKIYKIQKTDDNNFLLLDANPADFSGIPTGWQWRKVSIAPTGRINKIEMKNPVVIHSAKHGLVNKDRVVIMTIDNVTQARLDNLINRNIRPYEVETAGPDSFTLTGVDATVWGSPDLERDLIGVWIKVIEDFRKYERKWGGMRIEMKESETETRERTPTNPGSTPLSTTIRPGQGEAVHTEIKLNTGTLGCIATDELTGKKVLLSNAHVLYSGTDNDEVHHPDYYVSSKTCSKHKIAERVRQVFGPDPANPNVTVDAAIAKFDPDDQKYDPFIIDIGFVKGTAEVQADELINNDYRVWKRGAQTGITEGIITTNNLTFADDGIQWRDQLRIAPIAGPFRGFISVRGDSGSVVVNKENKVVGLLFKAFADGGAAANPIKQVEDSLKIKIWKEGDPLVAGAEPVELENEQRVTVGIPQLFAHTIEELSSTEAGSNLTGVIHSHFAEVVNLMAVNKRFAAVWRRNHGPELMQRLREAIEVRNKPMPTYIYRRPVKEFVINIFEALRKFGSPRLAADVERYDRLFLQLLGYSYEDMLQFFQRDLQFVHE